MAESKEDEDRHWYLAYDIIDSNIITIRFSKDGSYLECASPIENKWFSTRLEAEDYIKVIKRRKKLEEMCNNITEENMNIVEWGTDKNISYIINAINNSCYKSKLKFELIEAVIDVARKYKLDT